MTGNNHSGVLLPPPLLYIGAVILVLVLDWAWPVAVLPEPVGAWVGSVLLITGLALNLWGVMTMKRARTPISPYQAVDNIIATGPFRLTRNPLYVGLDLVFLGITFLFNSLWGLLVLVPVLVVMHYGVILREERYLESRFGEAYREYCRNVGRYF